MCKQELTKIYKGDKTGARIEKKCNAMRKLL